MPRAYSQDLRGRVLAAVDEGMPVYTAAPVFRVSVSYIYKVLARRQRTGETSARAQRGHCTPRLGPHLDRLAAHVGEIPDATLAELGEWLIRELGVAVSRTTLWTTLDRLGFTLKKRPSARASRIGRTWQRRDWPGAHASVISTRPG